MKKSKLLNTPPPTPMVPSSSTRTKKILNLNKKSIYRKKKALRNISTSIIKQPQIKEEVVSVTVDSSHENIEFVKDPKLKTFYQDENNWFNFVNTLQFNNKRMLSQNLIEFFLVKYRKTKHIVFLDYDCNEHYFRCVDIDEKYKKFHLKMLQKKIQYVSVCKRGKRIAITAPNDPNQIVISTMGQLYMFRWLIKNLMLDFIVSYKTEISAFRRLVHKNKELFDESMRNKHNEYLYFIKTQNFCNEHHLKVNILSETAIEIEKHRVDDTEIEKDKIENNLLLI